MKPTKFNERNSELAKIHLAKRDLCLSDDEYRAALWSVCRVKSSAQLDFAGRKRMLDYFVSCGWQPAAKTDEWSWVNTAAQDRRGLLWKVRRTCIEIGIEPGKQKRYAEGAARRQTGIDRKLELMDQGQLWLLAGVLERTRQHKQEQGK